MDLEWKETEMEALNLADNALKGLKPDPAWDVSGVRDMAGGVIAVALVLCVGVIIIGCVSLIPGLVSNNQMERAFSWKRLLAAMLVPFVIGAAVSGWGWSCNVFGSNGLGVNRSYTQSSGSGKTNLRPSFPSASDRDGRHGRSMDAGASASARPAGLPVHDAPHPASRARPAGAASHSRKGAGRGLDRPLAASAAGPRPAITARRPVN